LKNIYGGGSKTTKHGNDHEVEEDLEKFLKDNSSIKITDHENRKTKLKSKYKDLIQDKRKIGVIFQKHAIKEFYEERNDKKNLNELLSKILLPDDVLVLFDSKTAYVVEKKYQKVNGSVDEKLESGPFKKSQYEKIFSQLGYQTEFVYIVNKDYFDKPKYKDLKAYLKKHNIEIHYSLNEVPYFSDIIK
jgi:hypothetical protein